MSSNPHWEPYGAPVAGAFWGGLQFTGHYQDRVTRLTHMQQRYYDPYAGRFLAVDPVATSPGSFNRYWYANNNPYRFFDPDGRDAADRAYGAAVGYMLRNDPEKMRIWAGAEAAAITEGSLAEQGAGMGQAIGEFVDTGDFSAEAVAGVAVNVAVTAVTRGKAKVSNSRRPTASQREGALQRSRDESGVERCTYCNKPLDRKSGSSDSAEIDHRKPYSRGGKTEDGNLDAACRDCNRSKGSKELGTEWVPPKDRDSR